ncbi:MAG: DNA gyrase inhibitor YacG [Tepidimonas sp.]|uniref:DNA gyrase inhibitor YacG n=1 Tax=Tepidimonas sp. TaxID=2002775 RepID=UPI004055055C
MTQPFETRTVTCPACGSPSRYAVDNPWRPFCSERCKQLDLGAWASERYRVADPSHPDLGTAEQDTPQH